MGSPRCLGADRELDNSSVYASLPLETLVKGRNNYVSMMKLSKQEITYLLKLLLEHKTKLERIKPYPSQERDLRPYEALIRKLTQYRAMHLSGPLRRRKTHSSRG